MLWQSYVKVVSSLFFRCTNGLLRHIALYKGSTHFIFHTPWVPYYIGPLPKVMEVGDNFLEIPPLDGISGTLVPLPEHLKLSLRWKSPVTCRIFNSIISKWNWVQLCIYFCIVYGISVMFLLEFFSWRKTSTMEILTFSLFHCNFWFCSSTYKMFILICKFPIMCAQSWSLVFARAFILKIKTLDWQ